MKRILFILSFITLTGSLFGQDTAHVIYNDQRGNFFIKVENVPAWQIDGYNKVIRN